MPTAFDPEGPASPESGVFGIPCTLDDAAVVVLPVPFDATTSYRAGCADGPRAIRNASVQVDLFDHQFGPVYERGIHMLDEPGEVRALSRSARELVEPILDKGGAGDEDAAAVADIDDVSRRINGIVLERSRALIERGKTVGVVGGDHSTPFGAIYAAAKHFGAAADTGLEGGTGLGILQVDAHMDLRKAYEGFAFSHASIMYNVLADIPEVTRLVQIGIRDYARTELELARSHAARVGVVFDHDIAAALDEGESFAELCRVWLDPLPHYVWISWDIDGLDPALCPHTGTPVPGGLTWRQACMLLEAVAHSGREVVGFDLVEVTPGHDPDEPEWDANVGARLLYKLCGVAGRRGPK